MNIYTISFIGLPLSGKKTIINSLINNKIIDYNLINEIIEDDNCNKFKIINFKKIIDVNLLIWISDINTAFITIEEINEYEKIKNNINKLYYNTGIDYNLIIMLSKCDRYININIINKIKTIFPNDDILLFNAYGRIYHNKNLSIELKNSIIKINNSIPSKYNIYFDITKYVKYYYEEQKYRNNNKFLNTYKNFLNGTIDINYLFNVWELITIEDKLNHLNIICNDIIFNNNYKIFQYIQTSKNILNKITIINYNIIYKKLIQYYIDILNNNYYSKKKNLVFDYTYIILLDNIIEKFIYLDKNIKNKLYNNLFFSFNLNINNNFTYLNKINRINILKKIHNKGYTKYDFNFENNFNNFILNTNNKDDYNKFYNIIINIIDIDYNFNN
jgi:hypothetical protein